MKRQMTGQVKLTYEGHDDAKAVLEALGKSLLEESMTYPKGELLFDDGHLDVGLGAGPCSCGRDGKDDGFGYGRANQHTKDCTRHEQVLVVSLTYEVKKPSSKE